LPETFLEEIWFFRGERNSSFNDTAIAGKDGYIGLHHRWPKKSGASFKWSPTYIIQQTFKASLCIKHEIKPFKNLQKSIELKNFRNPTQK